MKPLLIILFITACLFLSCSTVLQMNNRNPSKKSFKYYSASYKFNRSSTALKTGTKYYYRSPADTGIVSILLFFEDGYLNKFATPTRYIDSIKNIRVESGVIMGYFTTRNDSIFFSTKSYYQQNATQYEGKVTTEALELMVKYPNKKESIAERYTLQ